MRTKELCEGLEQTDGRPARGPNSTSLLQVTRAANGAAKPPRLSKRGNTRQGKIHLLNRADLDGRTNASKVFDRLVAAIHADLGGRDQLSAVELALVEAYASATVVLDHLNAQILTGANIDSALVAAHAQAISAMVRVAAKLGTARRAKPVADFDTFIEMRERAKRIAAIPSEGAP